MRILLVDDEVELVSALAQRLGFRGFEADWAGTGDEGLEKVRENRYDLAILDVKMPRYSGLELQKLMAEIQPDLKFIFLSGHGSEEDYRKGASQAVSYLVKPVSIEQLLEKIKEAQD